MAREDQHFRLRLPADLRALVEKAAERNRRSMTAEILARLSASFPLEEATAPDNPFERYADATARALAAEAATQAIGSLLAALNAPEGTSDAERFQLLVRGAARNAAHREDPEGAN